MGVQNLLPICLGDAPVPRDGTKDPYDLNVGGFRPKPFIFDVFPGCRPAIAQRVPGFDRRVRLASITNLAAGG